MSADVLQRLAAIVPPGRLLDRPEHLAAYESDGLTAFRTRPLAVVTPETVDEVIAANPQKVEEVKAKPKMASWFTGQVMKATGGKANPGVVNAVLKQRLGLPEEG